MAERCRQRRFPGETVNTISRRQPVDVHRVARERGQRRFAPPKAVPSPGRGRDCRWFGLTDGRREFTTQRAFCVVATDAARTMEDRVCAVVVMAHLNARLDEVRTQRGRWDLQSPAMERHRVVVADLTFLLDAKDLVQVDARDRHERRAVLFGLHRKASVGQYYTSPTQSITLPSVV